jgi:ubiquinone biosynthesis protein
MVSVEGVARRIYPEHNLWEAARPVVRDWISRELSPVAEAKRLFEAVKQRLNDDPSERIREALTARDGLRQDIRRSQGLALVALIVAALSLGVMVWLALKYGLKQTCVDAPQSVKAAAGL